MNINTCTDCGSIIENNQDSMCEDCNESYEKREDLKLLNTTKYELQDYLRTQFLTGKEKYQVRKELNLVKFEIQELLKEMK